MNLRRWVLWALATSLCAYALVQAGHRAGQGRSALVKWRPDVEALQGGEPIYGREAGGTEEGFPTLPLTAIAIAPFLGLGDAPGAVAWAAIKVALAAWMVAAALRLASGSLERWPLWAITLVVLLSLRVLLSDVAHGNTNIVVGATVVAAGSEWHRRRDLRAGLWIGLGSVLKLTPALFAFYFLWRRSARALAGWLLGLALFALAIPSLALGWSANLAQASGWWRQMAGPYLAGAPPSIVQTEHINQSYLGVLARLTTESVAIRARPPAVPRDVSVNLLSLSPGALRALHLALCAATLAFVAICLGLRPRERTGPRVLGELALVSLAMAFLSERSWKHHWVLLILPVAFLTWTLATRPAHERAWKLAAAALAASALLNGLTGSGVLGPYGSDLAEAYGAWLAGGLALFLACGWLLRKEPDNAKA